MRALGSSVTWCVFCLLWVVAVDCFSWQPRATRSGDLLALGKEFVKLMRQGDFESAVTDFDATMTRVMPAEKLEGAWKSIVGSAGPFREQLGANVERSGQYEMVVVTCRFEKGPLDVKVVFDSEKRITGLWFAPSRPAVEYKPPAYANPKAFDEREVQVGVDPWILPATLAIPNGDGPFAAVVLVHGSGPNDRDETVGPNKPFRDLAWGLASRGIAVLRYEKRTKEHASKLVASKSGITVYEETIEDALAAVSLLRATEGIDAERVFVLGHSLGGNLIPRIGKLDAKIAGFVVLAGSTRPLEDIYLEQMSYVLSLDGDVSEDDRKRLDEIEKQVARVKDSKLSESTPAGDLPLGVPAEYWLDLRDYCPPRVAKELEHPMLILQAERDYQVTMECFEGWRKELGARQNVQMKVYPKLNHLFIEGEGRSTPSEYANGGNLAKEVVVDIAAWLGKH
jgi:dienelactone hydrolase